MVKRRWIKRWERAGVQPLRVFVRSKRTIDTGEEKADANGERYKKQRKRDEENRGEWKSESKNIIEIEYNASLR